MWVFSPYHLSPTIPTPELFLGVPISNKGSNHPPTCLQQETGSHRWLFPLSEFKAFKWSLHFVGSTSKLFLDFTHISLFSLLYVFRPSTPFALGGTRHTLRLSTSCPLQFFYHVTAKVIFQNKINSLSTYVLQWHPVALWINSTLL